jgi:hypothetical protein
MPQPGDVLLVAGGMDWQSRAIRIGTHSHWTHCALKMGGTFLAESTQKGIALVEESKYAGKDTHWIDTGLTQDQRLAACRYASSMTGKRYGKLQIASLVLRWLTHAHLFFAMDDTETCSSYCAKAMEHGEMILPVPAEIFEPADFSRLYHVTPQMVR